MRAIVPCFNSPAAMANELIYDISFSLREPSYDTPEPLEMKNLTSKSVNGTSVADPNKDLEANTVAAAEEDSNLLSNKKTVTIVAAAGK